ncbi:hypothetical protein ACHAXT_010168 [Thalassiosira profunda]
MPQQIASQGGSISAATDCNLPQAPPGANRVQLELWRRILLRRSEQIQSLSPTTLQSYADAIALDLTSSRFKKVSGRQRDVDLAKGYLSAHLLSHPLPPSVAVQNVLHHIMALFFRSIDERLPPCERKYGLDAVKRALLSLDNALAERGNTQMAAGENQSTTVHNSKTSRDEKDGAPISGDDSSRDKPAASEKAVGNGTNPSGHQKDASKQTQPGASSQEKRKANENGNIGKEGATETAAKRQRKEQQLSAEATANVRPKPSQNREPEIVLIDSDTEDESTEDKAIDGNPPSEKASSSQMALVQNKQRVSEEKKDAIDGAAADSTVDSAKVKGVPGKPAPSQPTPAVTRPQPSAQKPAPRKAAADAKTAVRALPPPIPFSRVRHVAFAADNHTPYLASASLRPRNPCTLSYDAGFNANGSGACLDHKSFLGVRQRLETFDPFWKVIHELGAKQCPGGQGRTTKVATRTAACVSSVQLGNHPTSCAVVEVDLRTECSSSRFDLDWGKRNTSYKTGDRRLLLRMLPLKRTEKDEQKSSDTHKWPIGTFIQVSRGAKEQVLIVAQRRQQSHDPKLWKGLSHPLDLTTFLPDANLGFALKICAKEAIERAASPKYKLGTEVSKEFENDDGEMRPFSGTVKGFDPDYLLYRIVYEDGDAEELTETEVAAIVVKKRLDVTEEPKLLQGSYGIHLAVCEYIGPDDLYTQLLKVLPTIPLGQSRRMAKQYLVRQTVSIDSDDDEDGNLGGASLNFSLLCPMSKMAIGTPVRGQHCKHIQCFDLKSFLHSNKSVSGGRWRCGCCEDFVSVKDLVRCGLFEAMLQDHREEVSGARHEVSFKSDGTWEMKGSEAGSRRGSSSGAAGDGDAGDGAGEPSGKQPEVIDLL